MVTDILMYSYACTNISTMIRMPDYSNHTNRATSTPKCPLSSSGASDTLVKARYILHLAYS